MYTYNLIIWTRLNWLKIQWRALVNESTFEHFRELRYLSLNLYNTQDRPPCMLDDVESSCWKKSQIGLVL